DGRNIAGMVGIRRRNSRRRLRILGNQVFKTGAGSSSDIIELEAFVRQGKVEIFFRADLGIFAVIDAHQTTVLETGHDVGDALGGVGGDTKPVEPLRPLGGFHNRIGLVVDHVIDRAAEVVVHADADGIAGALAGIGGKVNGAVG